MRALVQRVSEARVEVDGAQVGRIGPGLLVLAGVAAQDHPEDLVWLARKILALRIFADAHGLMNRSVAETGGEVLAVSQFTLYASTRKGNRPSYTDAAPPEVAAPLFRQFVANLESGLGRAVPTGVFGAHMQVALCNDGPVTIWLDTARRD
jgi:D-tyrosyl-tRNA(Tyr) deacylase